MFGFFFKTKDSGESIYSRLHNDLIARQETDKARTIVRDLDRIYDRVTDLRLYRRESVRCLIAAAGKLLEVELAGSADEYRHIDATSRELLQIALNELGLELKE